MLSPAIKTTQAHKVPCKSLNSKQKLELCALQTVKPLKLLQILEIHTFRNKCDQVSCAQRTCKHGTLSANL